MLNDSLIFLFDRDLKKLMEELKSYDKEEKIWEIQVGISNSAGNLALHIAGNLQHFVGAVLDNSGYERKRDEEFSPKNIPLEVLISGLTETNEVVKSCLSKLSAAHLEKVYPLQVFGYEMTTEFFLIHLQSHLNYHLGQVNYHRRMMK